MKDVDLAQIFFRYYPAFKAIQEDGLNIAAQIKPDLVLKLYCLDFMLLWSRVKAPLALLKLTLIIIFFAGTPLSLL